MDASNVFIMTPTDFGYKLVRANKTVDFEKFNVVQAGPNEYYLERISGFKLISNKSIEIYDFRGCKIIQCVLDNNIIQIKSLNKLLEKLYLIIDNKDQIKKKSLLYIELVQNNIKGWSQITKLGISYPKPKPNITIREIINQLESTDIKLLLKLELENKQLVKLKINL
jgi:hypothetical protein